MTHGGFRHCLTGMAGGYFAVLALAASFLFFGETLVGQAPDGKEPPEKRQDAGKEEPLRSNVDDRLARLQLLSAELGERISGIAARVAPLMEQLSSEKRKDSPMRSACSNSRTRWGVSAINWRR